MIILGLNIKMIETGVLTVAVRNKWNKNSGDATCSTAKQEASAWE